MSVAVKPVIYSKKLSKKRLTKREVGGIIARRCGLSVSCGARNVSRESQARSD